MKQARFALLLLALSACQIALASSGTILFRGAIVNTPCVIPATTWLHYAEHPAVYDTARKAKPNPSCADVSATHSVKVSHHAMHASVRTSQTTEPGRAWVTVIYN